MWWVKTWDVGMGSRSGALGGLGLAKEVARFFGGLLPLRSWWGLHVFWHHCRCFSVEWVSFTEGVTSLSFMVGLGSLLFMGFRIWRLFLVCEEGVMRSTISVAIFSLNVAEG